MATGDILSVTITDKTTAGLDTDGWYADVVIEGGKVGGTYDFGLGANNDPAGAKLQFQVRSEGYNAAGTLGTIDRVVYATRVLRKAYPNDSDIEEAEGGGNLTVRVALSDYIYNDDKAGGAGTSLTNPEATFVDGWHTNDGAGGGSETTDEASPIECTNNSTLDYPKVVGRWATVPYQRVDSDFLVEAVCFHRSARNGKPVACVKFDAADQSANSSTQQTVTAMTVSAWDAGDGSADAKSVSVYAATMDIDALDDTEVIDCNFIAYPWIGDADSILDTRTTEDGVAQPDERLGPLHMLNDKGDTLRKYAFVDPAGDNGTAVTSATRATAKASPYATIEAAGESLSGESAGEVVCEAGTYSWTEIDPATPPPNTWIVVKPETGAAVTIENAGNADSDGKIAIHGVTLDDNGQVGMLRGNTSTGLLWLHNIVDYQMTGTAPIYQWKGQFHTRAQSCTAAKLGPFGINPSPIYLCRGNNYSSQAEDGGPYCCIGNVGVYLVNTDASAQGHQLADNSIIAWNYNTNVANSTPFLPGWFSGAGNAHGFAVVGNVHEVVGSSTQPALAIGADSGTFDTDHIILAHNVIVGSRCNLGYNDNGTNSPAHLNWLQRGNIIGDWNHKDDTFASDPNGARNGAWPVGYNVGSRYNMLDAQTGGVGFQGEFDGLDTTWGTDADFVDDSSEWGDDGGDGDYNLNDDAGFGLDLIPLADQVMPFDLNGVAMPTLARIGALQVAATSEDQYIYWSSQPKGLKGLLKYPLTTPLSLGLK